MERAPFARKTAGTLALELRRRQRRSRQAPIGPTLTATGRKGQPLERPSLRPREPGYRARLAGLQPTREREAPEISSLRAIARTPSPAALARMILARWENSCDML